MSDCIDAQIMDNLRTAILDITTANGYNTDVKTVEFPRSIVRFDNDSYPYVLLIPNETDPVQEYEIREDVLPFLLWYFDGQNDDEPDTEPFVWRLRNVAADFTKALKSDPTLNGTCENIRIVSHNFGIFCDENIMESGVYMYIEIDRTINPDNPYEF